MEAIATEKVEQSAGSCPRFVPEPAIPGRARLARARCAARPSRRFEALGFPTPKDEDWRYTGVQPDRRRFRGPGGAAGILGLAKSASVSRRTSSARPGRRRRVASAAIVRVREERLRRAEHRALRGRGALILEIAPGAVVDRADRDPSSTPAPRTLPRRPIRECLVLAGERSQATVVETLRRIRAGLFTNAVTEIAPRATARVLEHYKLQQESLEARPRPDDRGAAGSRQPVHLAQRRPRSRARAHRHLGSVLDGEGARVRAERSLRRPRTAAPGQPHVDRPRDAARHEPRALQGRSWTAGLAGRLPRDDHRPAGRAEDRRHADQQEPAPLARGAGQLDARARDLRRRRQVQARLDDRPARRGRRSSTCARAASARRRPGRS